MRALVLIPALALAACGGGDEPDPRAGTSGPSSTATSQESSSHLDLAAPPARPESMDAPTTEGAIAAAAYVLDVYTYTVNSGDLTLWRSVTRASCSFCAGVTADVEARNAAGQRIVGGDAVVGETTATEISAEEWFAVEMAVVQRASARTDRDGKELSARPDKQYEMVFALSWDDGFRVDEMGVEQDES